MAAKGLPSDMKVLLTLSLFLCLSTMLIVFDMNKPVICPTNTTLHHNQEYSKKIVVNYFDNSSPYLKELQLDDASIDSLQDVSRHQQPVIVTASSSSHVSDTIIWLKEMSKKLLKLKLIVYDLGMTEEQRALLSTMQCEVRIFPFNRFPSFIKENINAIAWKPLLIQLCLIEFGHVLWMDATVRLTDDTFDNNFEVTGDDGISLPYNRGIDVSSPLHYVTSIDTFNVLGEHPCTFQDVTSFNAGIIVIRKTQFVFRYVMKPWVSCALNKVCINGGQKLRRMCSGANTVGFCHKYDTSVLSIILHRLYSDPEDRNKIDLSDKINWIKCYSRKELIVWDDAIFTDFQRYDQTYCRKLGRQ